MPEEKLESEEPKKCLVYYKTGFFEGRFFGERFDGLDACCAVFEEMFLHSGNEKNCSWEKNTLLSGIETGLNFVKKEGGLAVFFCGKSIGFCPWSGHAVEVRERREVVLKRKLKAVPDGYQEIDSREGWDK